MSVFEFLEPAAAGRTGRELDKRGLIQTIDKHLAFCLMPVGIDDLYRYARARQHP
ncbi:hypothetical protein ABQZ08_03830 [Xanthomonas hortorum pv. hederae]